MRLSVKACAFAGSILCGFGLLLLTWWIILHEGATGEITFIGRVYWGYRITPAGSVIGLLWGLADGAVGGALFALLYNVVVARARTT